MVDSEIAGKASFESIRYAQLWEDADTLLVGLEGCKPGSNLVSICSAGDNALAMLLLAPNKVFVVDLSAAQIECLRIRIEAYRSLSYTEFLGLMGSRPSAGRADIFDRVCANLVPSSQEFWKSHRDDVIAYGLGGIGKFENYFRIMRRWLLPLVHSRKTLDDVFVNRDVPERIVFYNTRWNTWRWRTLLKVFFSRFTMGRLGRDPAFFDHVNGSVADHVARKIVHAAIDLDPADNPYLHWILNGDHGRALPVSWRAENFDIIRDRLDRIEIHQGSLEALIASGQRADGFNLSDIFEYMTPDVFSDVYGEILRVANPGARIVYWNMMVPRRCPDRFASNVQSLGDVETRGKAIDKAFFYSDFVVEQVK